jgi:peptidoglycan hydrolase-like protein with peptidoglycan-binding domain
LNLTGNNVGRPDGAFGPKTRAGITTWQTQNGLVPSGYFTAAQYVLLTSQTEAQYAAYVAEVNRKRAAAAAAKKTRSSTTRANTATNRNQNTRQQNNNNNGGNTAGAAFMGGVVGGIIGGAIGSRY